MEDLLPRHLTHTVVSRLVPLHMGFSPGLSVLKTLQTEFLNGKSRDILKLPEELRKNW